MQAPAELFADLIEADQLDRIFLYDNDTQDWFLFDPDPGFEAANSLETVGVRRHHLDPAQGSAATVQGKTSLAQTSSTGWSLITVQ